MLEYNIFNYRVKGFTMFVGKYTQRKNRSKGYIGFVGKYATDRRKRSGPTECVRCCRSVLIRITT